MVLATAVLLPLYLYPTSGAWDWVTKGIETYPSLPFTVIVNPESGPGATHSYPESDYISAIASLSKYDNVKLIGYVTTAYMDKTQADVETEIETCKCIELCDMHISTD